MGQDNKTGNCHRGWIDGGGERCEPNRGQVNEELVLETEYGMRLLTKALPA